MSDCSICYDPVIDFPAPEATGSHRSSCGHLFHPKCIAKWHLSQDHSTCPMCRKVAMDLEDCAPEEESEPPAALGVALPLPVGWPLDAAGWERFEELEALAFGISARDFESREEGFHEGGEILLQLWQLNDILLQAGGVGMTASVKARLEINEDDVVITERYEIDNILREQGCNPLSDAQWTQLFS